jgi:hypothetical protein
VTEQLSQDFAGVHVLDHRAFWHLDLQRLTTPAVKILAFAMDTVQRPPVRMITEGKQRGHVVVGNQPDIATVATVATIRTAVNNGTFASERDASGAAVPSTDVELALVDELGHAVTLATNLELRR